ncbi:MAG: hypothetical protein M3R17_06100 [Bacteroidota bacterium]|nr:hypothetical protein [Bacteroidota bacterium]
MNTHSPDSRENKSKSAANNIHTKQGNSEHTFKFTDNRSETIAQQKLQELANTNPRAKHGPAGVINSDLPGAGAGNMQARLNARENTTVFPQSAQQTIQRLTPDNNFAVNNYYEEIQDDEEGREDELTLRPITEEEYDEFDNDAAVTFEEGFLIFDIEEGEDRNAWQLNTNVADLYEQGDTGTYFIKRVGSFRLPISCIEASEHIINYALHNNIPDWQTDQQKSVNLHLSRIPENDEEAVNAVALNISDAELTQESLADYTSYDFESGGLALNEGLLVVDKNNPAVTLHAVAVVGINQVTGQFIVVERNAGNTTGDNNYLDDEWVLNVYPSAGAFKASIPHHENLIIGKLVIG